MDFSMAERESRTSVSSSNQASRNDSITSNGSGLSQFGIRRQKEQISKNNLGAVGLKNGAIGKENYSSIQWRTFASITKLEWAYFIICGLVLLGTLAITIERISTFAKAVENEPTDGARSYFVVNLIYAVVFFVNVVFCVTYLGRGLFGERPFELMALSLAAALVLVYSVVEYVISPPRQVREGVEIGRTLMKTIRLALVCVFAPIGIAISVYLARMFYKNNNLIYRALQSANIGLQKMCRWYFACQSMMLFDLQLQVSFGFEIRRSFPNPTSYQPSFSTSPLTPKQARRLS